jgi:hypothetical protein
MMPAPPQQMLPQQILPGQQLMLQPQQQAMLQPQQFMLQPQQLVIQGAPTQRTLKTALTYGQPTDAPREKRKARTSFLIADDDEEEYVLLVSIVSLTVREEELIIEKPPSAVKKNRKLLEERDDQDEIMYAFAVNLRYFLIDRLEDRQQYRPRLIASPTKASANNNNNNNNALQNFGNIYQEREPQDPLANVLNFRSFQSPLDNTWWSYITTLPGLSLNCYCLFSLLICSLFSVVSYVAVFARFFFAHVFLFSPKFPSFSISRVEASSCHIRPP